MGSKLQVCNSSRCGLHEAARAAAGIRPLQDAARPHLPAPQRRPAVSAICLQRSPRLSQDPPQLQPPGPVPPHRPAEHTAPAKEPVLQCAPSLCLHMPTCRHQHVSHESPQAVTADMRPAWLCGLPTLVLLAAHEAAPNPPGLQTGTAGKCPCKASSKCHCKASSRACSSLWSACRPFLQEDTSESGPSLLA